MRLWLPPPRPPPQAGEGVMAHCKRRRAALTPCPARRMNSAGDTMGARQFGARVKRLEDPALLTGRGRFVDDVKLPGTLEACFVRSPHAHARIRAIDTSAARAAPGVHA